MTNIQIKKILNKDLKIQTICDDLPDDLFISCISFEPRTLAVIRSMGNFYHAKFGLFIKNKKFENSNKLQEHSNEIQRLLKEKRLFKKTKEIFTSIDNPIKIIVELEKIIQKEFGNNDHLNVSIDITTIPRAEILTLLYYLRNNKKIDELRLFYTTPNEYGKWLTDGYEKSFVPPFFEGPAVFTKQKTALFILTGFEYDRILSLIDELEPSLVILGYPNPGTSPKYLSESKKIIKKLKIERDLNFSEFQIPGNNPYLCKITIDEIIANYPEYNFILTILGTKLELLGAFLSYEENPQFRVIYPIPAVYNIEDYSKGCDEVYEIFL
jgi:hypothetical protein